MARMIPAEVPPDVKSKAERDMFGVLRDGLDDSFTVFYSFDMLSENHNGKLVDGEIDFLVFHRELGLLVVEVKGGAIRYDGEQGIWYQNGKAMSKSPFAQAEASKYKLGGDLKKKLGHDTGCTFGHAVCFPDVYAELQTTPSGADPRVCITGSQLQRIDEAVRSVFGAYHGDADKSLSKEDADRIRQFLMPQFEYGASLMDRMGHAEKIFFRLTEEQCGVLDIFREHRQVLIRGCAGSGKTVMAVKKARELGLEGKSVLLLAYNELISERLAEHVKDVGNVTASSYHKFSLDHLDRAGMKPAPAESTNDFYKYKVPDAFLKLLEKQPLKYDAIIVDEAQDFHPSYWITVTEMLKEDSYFYIFYDPHQNVFKADQDLPISGPPFTLQVNCRNTRRIFEYFSPYAQGEMRLTKDAPEGDPVEEWHIADGKERRKRLGKILHDLVVNKEVPAERIAVLGGHRMEHTCIGDNPEVGNFRVVEGLGEGPMVLHYYTYMKFKGCEADAVILLDVDPDDERWSPERLYTAMSRAKYLLYVLYANGGKR